MKLKCPYCDSSVIEPDCDAGTSFYCYDCDSPGIDRMEVIVESLPESVKSKKEVELILDGFVVNLPTLPDYLKVDGYLIEA